MSERSIIVSSTKHALALGLGFLLACGGGHTPVSGDAGGDGRVEVALVPVTANRDVDVLFVFENSPSTAGPPAVRASGTALFDTLGHATGGLPKLQLGVATSDLGTKGALDPAPGPAIGTGAGSCTGDGDSGNLRTEASVTGAYITAIDGSVNFTGTIADAFTALATTIGVAGCGFEQHVEAAKRALNNNPANAGFLRADASLVVVIVGDEDDCSIAHSTLLSNDTATFGPLASFRCTRFGVTCDTGGTTTDEMNTPGDKSGCHSNDASDYLTHIADYVTYFQSLKPDPRMVAVDAIVGDPSPVAVELRPLQSGGTPIPALAHSCSFVDTLGQTAVGDPAVRIAALASAFRRHEVDTVCANDASPALTAIGRQINGMVGTPCLERDIAQPADCRVFDEDSAGFQIELLPCTSTLTTDCYAIDADATACPDGQHLKLVVTRSGTAPLNTMTSVRCKL